MDVKIYFQNRALILSIKEATHITTAAFHINKHTPYHLFNDYTQHWLSSDKDTVVVFEDELLLLSFLNIYLPSQFKVLRAAGGVVFNPEKKEYLFIFKRNAWDLPKGKIDPYELADQTAIREIYEETGINIQSIKKNLGLSYHLFYQKNEPILKITQWFLMHTNDYQNIQPQTEEDIEKVEWKNLQQIQNDILNNTYPSIKEIISRVLPINI